MKKFLFIFVFVCLPVFSADTRNSQPELEFPDRTMPVREVAPLQPEQQKVELLPVSTLDKVYFYSVILVFGFLAGAAGYAVMGWYLSRKNDGAIINGYRSPKESEPMPLPSLFDDVRELRNLLNERDKTIASLQWQLNNGGDKPSEATRLEQRRLQSERDELYNKCIVLERTIASSREFYERGVRASERTSAEFIRIKKDNERLFKDNAELNGKLKALPDMRYVDIINEANRIESDYSRAKIEHVRLSAENASLREELQVLRSKAPNEKLEKAFADLQKDHKLALEINEVLVLENTSLRRMHEFKSRGEGRPAHHSFTGPGYPTPTECSDGDAVQHFIDNSHQ